MDDERTERMADLYLGIPFVKGGRDFNSGLDCYGLIIHFYWAVYAIRVSDCIDHPLYDRTERAGSEVAASLLDEWPTVEEGSQRIGDLAVMSILGLGVDHVGIILRHGMMLHSRKPFGCIRSRISDVSGRIVRYARHRDREA